MTCEGCKLNEICYPDLNLRPSRCPEQNKPSETPNKDTDPDRNSSGNLPVDYGLLSGTDQRRTQAGIRRQHSR